MAVAGFERLSLLSEVGVSQARINMVRIVVVPLRLALARTSENSLMRTMTFDWLLRPLMKLSALATPFFSTYGMAVRSRANGGSIAMSQAREIAVSFFDSLERPTRTV